MGRKVRTVQCSGPCKEGSDSARAQGQLCSILLKDPVNEAGEDCLAKKSFMVCWGWGLGRLEGGGRGEDKEDRSLAVR